MPDILETQPIARKVLPIIYVLDASGSMQGSRIAAVNAAMEETLPVLNEISIENPRAEIKVGVLQFSSGSKWLTAPDSLTFLDDYIWTDIQAGGVTDLGQALNELNQKMSRHAFFEEVTGTLAPVVIFMSDGEPTDDYAHYLGKIRDNKWFKVSSKIAIAIGDDANKSILSEVVGNSEAVIQVDDLETLKKLIKVVSVTASQIGSQSRNSDEKNVVDEVITTVKEGEYNGIYIPSEQEVVSVPMSSADGDDDQYDFDEEAFFV